MTKYMKTFSINSLAFYLTNREEIINISHTIKPPHSSELDCKCLLIALAYIKFID